MEDTVAQAQFKAGLDYGMNIAKNKARDSIIEVFRDQVRNNNAEHSEAQELLDTILSACGMDEATISIEYIVEITYMDTSVAEFRVEAEDEDSAIEKVQEEIEVDNLYLNFTVSSAGQTFAVEIVPPLYVEQDFQYNAWEA